MIAAGKGLTAPALGGSRTGWSLRARLFHWTVALAILGLLALGLVMVNAPLQAGTKFELFQWHKAAGLLAGLLLAARTLARLVDRAPAPVEKGAPAALARGVHVALHVVPLALVASGYALASASIIPVPITLVGSLSVPLVGSPDLVAEERWRTLHHGLAFFLCGLVGLHVAAALWHHAVRRDGVLVRMLRNVP